MLLFDVCSAGYDDALSSLAEASGSVLLHLVNFPGTFSTNLVSLS